MAIIKDFAKGKSIKELSNDLKGVGTTAKGLQLFVKTEEVANNEEIQELIKVTNGKLTHKAQ